MPTRSEFVAEARKWVGTPFRHAQRQLGVGVDCVGLLICAANGLGLIGGYDFVNYSAVSPPGLVRAEVEKFCDAVDGPPEEGDILLFTFGGLEQHAAICNGDGGIIHAYQSAGFVGEHPLDGAWERAASGHYRMRGLG